MQEVKRYIEWTGRLDKINCIFHNEAETESNDGLMTPKVWLI